MNAERATQERIATRDGQEWAGIFGQQFIQTSGGLVAGGALPMG